MDVAPKKNGVGKFNVDKLDTARLLFTVARCVVVIPLLGEEWGYG